MPTYKAKSDIFLAHENRVVKAGDSFETEFPKVMNDKGKLVNMRLGSNIELVKASEPEPVDDPEDNTDDSQG